MALPGVKLNVVNNGLGLIPPSSESTMLYMGTCTGGTPNVVTYFADISSLQAVLGDGELVKAAAYELAVSGSIVGCMPLNASIAGGVSSVAHTGTGTATLAITEGPTQAITLNFVTTGVLGTGTFNYSVGGSSLSTAQVIPAGHTFVVPGTYTTVNFPTGTYTSGDVVSINTSGVGTHTGGGADNGVTAVSGPIDSLKPLLTVTVGGAVGTGQFVYTLDGNTANNSAAIVSQTGGYAIPGTGLVVTFTGTLAVGDTYTFASAGPSFSGTDLAAGLLALQTTYISSAAYSMVTVLGTPASAAAWATQTATLETAAQALFGKGVYCRFFNSCPSVGSITASAGAVVIDSADTDTVVATARAGVSAPHVVSGYGDCALTDILSGFSFRRNAIWAASARAAAVNASQDIGAVGDGALLNVTAAFRDEAATPGMEPLGFIVLRTFPGNISQGTGAPGFFVTKGHTMDAVTSDFFSLANARVVDRTCGVAASIMLPYVNAKIPTTTRNGVAGCITEQKAQAIEARGNAALQAALVSPDPADAQDAQMIINRLHNILADSQLIASVSVKPFAYSSYITVNIGLSPSAS